jgi:hypothetical protein
VLAQTLNPMPLVDPVRRFVLYTNAKCGGTTLKTWFFENVGFPTLHWRPATLFPAFGPAYAMAHLRRGAWLAFRATSAGRADPGSEAYKRRLRAFFSFYRWSYCAPAFAAGTPADWPHVCVVRHPGPRLVSAYLDKFCTGGPPPPFVQDVLRAIGRPDPSFADLLGYLETVDEAACNPHWRRQTYVLDGQRIDHFVRLEALHAEMSALADVVGAARLPLLQGRLQATRGRDDTPAADAAEDLSGASSLEIAARRQRSGGFPPAKSFLTPATTERLHRIYARDFDRLPYA